MLRVFLEQLIRLMIWMLFFIYELHVYIETHLVIINNCFVYTRYNFKRKIFKKLFQNFFKNFFETF